jgi:hypothetical protein
VLTIIGIGVLGVIIVVLVIVAMKPAGFRVARNAQIAAAPADVHALINDFRNWDGWSPWAKLDPKMKATYSGPPAGTGAGYHWISDQKNVGEGRMTILQSVPGEKVRINLEFIKPFASTSIAEFTIAPAAGGSTVEWAMMGEHNFVAKGFMMAMGGMDKVVGADFEKGLAQMKALAEKK